MRLPIFEKTVLTVPLRVGIAATAATATMPAASAYSTRSCPCVSRQNCTQNVFINAFSNLKKFRRECSFQTWLYRIAINHCSNLRQSWHSRHIVTAVDDSIMENAQAVTDSPLRVLEIKELGERIQKTLDGLSEEYRLLLLLVADEELSYDEIAVLTEQTPDAVRGKLHRARRTFTSLFQKTA